MIIGHTRQIQLLDLHVRTNTWSHAYLFSGPRHVGKLAVARLMATALLCEKKTNSKSPLIACGMCTSCTSFAAGTHPDVFILDIEETGEQFLHIEEVRRMRERLAQSAYKGTHIVCIRDVARLTREAANAFLKVLEEPRGNVLFFLMTTNTEDVLGTIRSRAWHVRFWPVSEETISDGLQRQGVPGKQALKIARVSDGFPGVAMRLGADPEDGLRKAQEDRQHILFLLRASTADRMQYAAKLYDNTDRMHMWYIESITALGGMVHTAIRQKAYSSLIATADMCRALIEGEERFYKPYATKKIIFENNMVNLAL